MEERHDILEDFYSTNEKTAGNGKTHTLSSTSLRKEEALSLNQIIKEHQPKHTLEIGLALGASAIAIISAKISYNKESKHIALDPFQHTADNIGLSEIEKYSLKEFIEHKSEFSENFLNKEFNDNHFYDFIFIDGNHTIGQAVTDIFLSDKILNVNGIIGVHDSFLFSTAASIKYLIKERDYELINLNKKTFKTLGRQIKYSLRLGSWYCINVIPCLNNSVAFLRKRS